MSSKICSGRTRAEVRRRFKTTLLGALGCLLLGSGGSGCGPAQTEDPAAAEAPPPGYIAPSPQRPGDAQRGYDALVNFGYVRCGIPYPLFAAYSKLVPTK